MLRTSARRLSPHLRTSLLGLSILGLACLGGACSAGGGGATNLDADGDGVIDSLGKSYDEDGDGNPDLHTIGDSTGIGVDTDGDGDFDAIGYDTDGDGLIDALDIDGDGTLDVRARTGGDGDSDGGIDLGGDGDGDGDGDGPIDKPVGNFCDEFEEVFEPKTPTVYVLVDRSGSMKDEGFWVPLRSNLLPVIEELQADVRFGFGSYSGTSGACTGLEPGVSIAENNHSAIAGAYNSLEPLLNGETPTAQAIGQATQLLLEDESPGDRFILLVTDGNPDFCNDGEDTCAQDALIGALQESFAQGVRTLVFGLEASQFPIEPGTLDRYANAGFGEGVVWKKAEFDGNGKSQILYSCENSSNWIGAGGVASENIGTYSESAGSAVAFSSQDPAALATEMRSSLAGLKSCQIALNFSVKDASVGQVFVDDKSTPIPRADWRLSEGQDNVIELRGNSCDLWKSTGVDYFFAGFPCAAIVR